MFFEHFFNIVEDVRETAVCCPFDHFTSNQTPYKETNPSAHVNLTERLFHCKVCGTGYNEVQFIQKVLGCSSLNARKIDKYYGGINETPEQWDQECELSNVVKEKIINLGISLEVLTELKLKSKNRDDSSIYFPAFMYGQLIDVRKYTPGGTPKVMSRTAVCTGMIIPFDIWNQSNPERMTLICAGEKDMAVARSNGFNAITLTGGERISCLTPELFRNRKIVITFDNDGAGINGARKLANQLLDYTPYVKVVTKFHEVCVESGEDITDFFMKYQKTREDLINYIKETPEYVPTPEERNQRCPLVDLLTASKPEKINKLVQSNVQVVAVTESSFTAPTTIWAQKFKLAGLDDTMAVGESREWELTEDTIQDILHMMDNNFTEDQINKNIRILLKIPIKERCVKIKALTKQTIFKAHVTDLFETSNSSVQTIEYTTYSIGQKLESGKKYLITYKLVPHPYHGQQLTMISTSAVQANDSISTFTVNPETKTHLDVFRNIQGTIAEKVEIITEKVKGLLGYNGNNTLIQTIDLAYHTVLQFNFGSFKNVRGYLDTLVVGESRMGKSSTAETLRTTYNLGVFTSLAGNSATIPGLVGGSNKTASGGYQTRAGIIPQNHKGLIIFEEFGKSNANISTELTDIRSSNEVRITRVSGTITLPAMVRMIALTNVKGTSGQIKPIASYPNGLSIIIELIETAEDIARYDLLVVLGDKGASQIDPFWEPQTPFDIEAYKTRVRWVWSRTPEQIKISREVGLYIIAKANELNRIYECHIKIFGTECWKKITRLAIAVAGYLVSTSDYEDLIILQEHIDYAVAFLIKIYDNPTFKLKEYVEHERKYSRIDDEGIQNLQDIYTQHPGLILQLEQCATASRNVLGASTGLNNDDLNKALTRLTKGLFIKFANHDIIPTERFRLGLSRINKQTHQRRVGEE